MPPKYPRRRLSSSGETDGVGYERSRILLSFASTSVEWSRKALSDRLISETHSSRRLPEAAEEKRIRRNCSSWSASTKEMGEGHVIGPVITVRDTVRDSWEI